MSNTNHLAQSTSPYLLQHAENPVDWFPWGKEALEMAVVQDKPILVSIGYSSCHWCHVMAHESFEDPETAELMNAHFVNIKIDREERPDLDQIYMEAVQVMGLQGGWPLNVFLTPDQKPFYGGTYFPKAGWRELLLAVHKAFYENRDELVYSAEKFAIAVSESTIQKYQIKTERFAFDTTAAEEALMKLAKKFDPQHGGFTRAPKFPMPVVWTFVTQSANYQTFDQATQHLHLTLRKMASGGIYDQIGGGFSRYSVDGEWHVPHFEKMLYDNGQLLSLYAHAYRQQPDTIYRQVLLETTAWMRREMQHPEGGYFAALDADSEGVEGKFYVWSYDELTRIAGDHGALITDYFDVSIEGNWEGANVLRRNYSDVELAARHHLPLSQLEKIITNFKSVALKARDERIRPGLDDKRIAGWNGWALKGLSETFQVLQEPSILQDAEQTAVFLKSLIHEHRLMRFPNRMLEGYLEDYASVIQAFIVFYETTFDANYLKEALALTQTVMDSFFDEAESYFFFTAADSETLITRKKEIFDNVIPASNSIMAHNLYRLGMHAYRDDYLTLAKQMTAGVCPLINLSVEDLTNWAALAQQMIHPYPEIVIVGPDYKKLASYFHQHYKGQRILSAAPAAEGLDIHRTKLIKEGKTTIFVCFNRTCQLPVHTIEEALEQLP